MREMFKGHGNRKIKFCDRKIKLADLRKMSDAELNELGEYVINNLDQGKLERLWVDYKKNIELKNGEVDC